MKLRRLAAVALRGLLAAAAIALCVRSLSRLELDALVRALARASLPLVALAAAVNLIQMVVRALRLQALLAPARSVPMRRLVPYAFAASALSNVLPGQAGQLYRIYLLRERESVPAATAVSAALAEHVLEGLAILTLVAPLPLLLDALPRWIAISLCGLAALGALGMAMAWTAMRLDGRGPAWLSRFAQGASALRGWRSFAAVFALSIAPLLLDCAEMLLVLRAASIDVYAAAPLLILLAVTAATAIPAMPGHLGTLELGAVGALHLLGVADESALAFALLYHAMQIVPVTIAGLAALLVARPLARLKDARAAFPQTAPGARDGGNGLPASPR